MNFITFKSILIFNLIFHTCYTLRGQEENIVFGSVDYLVNALENAELRVGGNWEAVIQTKDWLPIKGKKLTILPDTTNWVKLSIKNSDKLDRFFELYLHSTTLNHAKAYIQSGSTVDSSLYTGNLFRVKDRSSSRRDLSIPFHVKAEESIVIYLSLVRKGFPDDLLLTIIDTRQRNYFAWQDTWIAIILGFSTLIFLTSLSLFILIGKIEYMYYSLYMGSGTLFLGSTSGHLALLLMPNNANFFETAPATFAALSSMALIFFASSYLETRIKFPSLTKHILLSAIVITLIIFITGLLFTKELIPSYIYRILALSAGVWLVLILSAIIILSLDRTIKGKRREDYWFLGIFLNPMILMIISILLEMDSHSFSRELIFSIKQTLVTSEVLTTSLFLVFFTAGKFQLVQKKNEKQRIQFASLLHSQVRGKLVSVVEDLERDENSEVVMDQLDRLIDTCRLGEVFMRQKERDLLELLKDVAFHAKQLLENESMSQNISIELSEDLAGIRLSEYWLLQIFLDEAINNIRKHSNYRWAILTANSFKHSSRRYVEITVGDDGEGLHRNIEIPSIDIEISNSNFEDFCDTYLKYTSTGIRSLFQLASTEDDQEVIIQSSRNNGIVYILKIRIQDSI